MDTLVTALKKVVARRENTTMQESKKATEQLKKAKNLIKHVLKEIEKTPESGSDLKVDELKDKTQDLDALIDENLEKEKDYYRGIYYEIDF